MSLRAASSASAGRPSLLQESVEYLDKALGSVSGVKVLLVDACLRPMLDLVSSQTGMLQNEVLLVDTLDTPDRPDLSYLPCVIITRPTMDAVRSVSHELEEGQFKSFHLVFTNIVDNDVLQAIANSDRRKLVASFDEIYLDFLPLTEDVATIRLGGASSALTATGPSPSQQVKIPMMMPDWTNADFARVGQGLLSVMLACSRRPVIRYRNTSKAASRIAAELGSRMRMVNTTFFDLKSKGTLLLILDRVDDPVTPLLTPNTYEAMLHEHFGIHDGVINFAPEDKGGRRPGTVQLSENDERETEVLSAQHDAFFSSHRDSEWGELCSSVKELIEAYKSLHHIDLRTASLSDFKDFMTRFPEAKAQSTMMTRHATIVGRLGEVVVGRGHTDLVMLEQDINCGQAAPNDHGKLVLEALTFEAETEGGAAAAAAADAEGADGPAAVASPKKFAFDLTDVLRLVMLYELRYEGKEAAMARSQEMRDALRNERGASDAHLSLIDKYARFGAAKNRCGQLYPKSAGVMKSIAKAISGFSGDVKSVESQHEPLLKRIMCQAQNGTLPESDYPLQSESRGQADATTRYSEVIVFIVGGATYQEARLVSRINRGKLLNDPTTFPTGAEIGPAGGGAQHKRTGSADAKSAGGGAGGGMLDALASRFKSATGEGDEEGRSAEAEGTVAPVSRMMNTHVRLVANGMLRTSDFMMSL